MIHSHLGPYLLISKAFELAGQAVASVVDDDVDAAEVRKGFGESGVDGGLFGDIAVEGEEVIFGGGG